MDVDPRLRAALAVQLRDRHGRRVGWKLGMGDRERIGGGPVMGHLTAATQLPSGGTYRPEAGAQLHADAELAIEIGEAGEIAGYGAALELCDLAQCGDAIRIVETNVFHRAFALGGIRSTSLEPAASGRLLVDGEERAAAPIGDGHEERVRAVADMLAAVGERLLPGDVLITGSVVQVPVRPGDEVVADLGELGSARLLVVSR